MWPCPTDSYFFKALLGFTAKFPDPLGGSLFQFRVVFVFPGHNLIEGFQLTQAHQLAFGILG
jgi:hypothetical protein